MNPDLVILVNENDEVLGEMEKMEAHRKGVLHRAISVLVFNSKGEWLLQQRAAHKYHSSLLWSNTACTHPMIGEDTIISAHRRLKEEMGMQSPLKKAFSFQYKAELDGDMIEHELDHVQRRQHAPWQEGCEVDGELHAGAKGVACVPCRGRRRESAMQVFIRR